MVNMMPSIAAKKNLIIVVQLLCLAALVVTIMQLRQHDMAHLNSRSLLAPELASHIQISSNGQQIDLQKVAENWQLTAPLQEPANGQRVQPILSLLTLPNTHRYLETDVNLEELGLEPAQATVRINQLVFYFGHPDLSGKKRYLLSAGGVYLVDDLIYPLINSGPQTFVATGTQ